MSRLDIFTIVIAIAAIAAVIFIALWKKKKRESFKTGAGSVIYGSDIAGNPVNGIGSREGCEQACKNNKECTHYTWLGPASKIPNTCWLKKVNGKPDIQDWPDSFTGSIREKKQDAPITTTGTNPMLEYHNMVRAKHGADPLVWDDGIAQHAQTWANLCTLQHGSSDAAAHGQNLAWGHGDQIAAAADWYDEYKDIQALNDITKGGHFTQMVWKNTKKMGCGVAQCSIPGWGGAVGPYYVCEYDPPGNVAFAGMEREHYPLQVQVNPSP